MYLPPSYFIGRWIAVRDLKDSLNGPRPISVGRPLGRLTSVFNQRHLSLSRDFYIWFVSFVRFCRSDFLLKRKPEIVMLWCSSPVISGVCRLRQTDGVTQCVLVRLQHWAFRVCVFWNYYTVRHESTIISLSWPPCMWSWVGLDTNPLCSHQIQIW